MPRHDNYDGSGAKPVTKYPYGTSHKDCEHYSKGKCDHPKKEDKCDGYAIDCLYWDLK